MHMEIHTYACTYMHIHIYTKHTHRDKDYKLSRKEFKQSLLTDLPDMTGAQHVSVCVRSCPSVRPSVRPSDRVCLCVSEHVCPSICPSVRSCLSVCVRSCLRRDKCRVCFLMDLCGCVSVCVMCTWFSEL
jgi:hypothetical protein